MIHNQWYFSHDKTRAADRRRMRRNDLEMTSDGCFEYFSAVSLGARMVRCVELLFHADSTQMTTAKLQKLAIVRLASESKESYRSADSINRRHHRAKY
jgi:hypothetical protein